MSTTFASSSLVRLLAQWAPPPGPAAEADLAARAGQWVSAFDAIGLQSAQRAIHARRAAGQQGGSAAPVAGVAQAFAQVRDTLAAAIARDAALPNEFTYAPYKRRHQELQRQMQQAIGALREQLREALARSAPPLQQLAALDAAIEKVTAPREEAVLRAPIALLEQRFTTHRAAHKAAHIGNDTEDDDTTGWRRPGGWLHAFEADWHAALTAELALRLEPVAGLVEAAGHELTHHA